MRPVIRKTSATVCLLAATMATLPGSTAHAGGWMDDWVAQKTETSPGYFEGQQRGYWQGGSFNARWAAKKDYLMTLERPRAKIGCGGVDIFMGGFSFLNFEYMVQKLQRILSNGGAISFDLALGVLCKDCATSISKFDALLNQLNGMQLDECKAGQSIVAISDKLGSAAAAASELGNAVTNIDITDGVSDLWTKATGNLKSQGSTPTTDQVARTTQDCSAIIKDLFINDANGTSLLQQIGVGKLGMDAQHADLMRGMFGDLRVESAANGYRVSFIAPCADNKDYDLNTFIKGDLWARPIGGATPGTCYQITDGKADFHNYYQTHLTNVANAMESKSGILTPEEKSIINTSPLSLYKALKVAVLTQQKSAISGNLATISAKAGIVYAIDDLRDRVIKVQQKAQEALVKGGGSVPVGKDGEKCLPAFSDGISDGINQMLVRLETARKATHDSYMKDFQETQTISKQVQTYEEAEKKQQQWLKKNLFNTTGRR